MRLDRILKDSGCLFEAKDGAIEVSSICCDSRKVSYGSLFVAIKGFASDGHDYIATAIGKGARVIVFEDLEAFDNATAAIAAIAADSHATESAVKMTLSRTRGELKTFLEKEGIAL